MLLAVPLSNGAIWDRVYGAPRLPRNRLRHARSSVWSEWSVSVPTLSSWAAIHEDFGEAFKFGETANDRVERSLYHRAVGYSYDSEKILQDWVTGEVIRVPIVVHVPPDVTAQIFWLKNRDPENWRERREVDVTGRATTTMIKADMTPQQAMEAFVAMIRGAEIVEAAEEHEECRGGPLLTQHLKSARTPSSSRFSS